MDKHDIIKMLQRQQINPTRQRVDIAHLLFSRHQHLCADEVLALLNGQGAKGTVSKATVYNTLNLFARHGLLHEVRVDNTKLYYDSNTDEHHHVYNIDTGELWDVAADAVSLVKEPNLPVGTIPVGIEVIYRVRVE